MDVGPRVLGVLGQHEIRTVQNNQTCWTDGARAVVAGHPTTPRGWTRAKVTVATTTLLLRWAVETRAERFGEIIEL